MALASVLTDFERGSLTMAPQHRVPAFVHAALDVLLMPPVGVSFEQGLDRHAGGAGSCMRLVGGDEDVQQFGGADAVDELDAGGVFPQRARGCRQRLARRNAFAQARGAQRIAVRGVSALKAALMGIGGE